MDVGERTGGPRGDRVLLADLARADELLASARSLAATADRHGLRLADVRRATIERLARDLVAAADALDAAMLGWTASELGIEVSEDD
jgi:hypothetical protein